MVKFVYNPCAFSDNCAVDTATITNLTFELTPLIVILVINDLKTNECNLKCSLTMFQIKLRIKSHIILWETLSFFK